MKDYAVTLVSARLQGLCGDRGTRVARAHRNGTNGIGPSVELVLGNGHHDEPPEPQQALLSWAEFIAEEPPAWVKYLDALQRLLYCCGTTILYMMGRQFHDS